MKPQAPTSSFRTEIEGEPRVLVFACRWCGAIGADAAGRRRLSLPAGFRLIEVECAARIDADTVLKALSVGIDGVAVIGCHLDGCRYNQANHAAAKRLALLAALLESVGLGADRLVTNFGGAHEGDRFAALIQGFDRRLRALGPLRPVPEPRTAAPQGED